jgi:metal-sulfur cluster biosynthetic enzyme
MDEREKEIREKLRDVVDPEIGASIMDMNLVDEVRIEGNKAYITYHLTAPFCPPVFALHIGRNIKKVAKGVEGIDEVDVKLKDHVQADDINKMLDSMV